MVRASLHEPIVTIVAESDRPGGVAAIHRDLLDHVFPFAHTADDLDLTPLLPTTCGPPPLPPPCGDPPPRKGAIAAARCPATVSRPDTCCDRQDPCPLHPWVRH